MGFDEQDSTAQKEVATRPLNARIERNDTYEEGPPVDIFALVEVDGKATHKEVPRAAVVANWDGPVKTLKEWALLITNTAE